MTTEVNITSNTAPLLLLVDIHRLGLICGDPVFNGIIGSSDYDGRDRQRRQGVTADGGAIAGERPVGQWLILASDNRGIQGCELGDGILF